MDPQLAALDELMDSANAASVNSIKKPKRLDVPFVDCADYWRVVHFGH